jgi:hypothetical protein
MSNQIEDCDVTVALLDATLSLAQYLGDDDAIGAPMLESEFPDKPAVLIENGASHTYAIYGTGAELMKFAERIKRQAQRVIDGERDLFGQYNYAAYLRTLDRPDEAAPWPLLSNEEKERYLP